MPTISPKDVTAPIQVAPPTTKVEQTKVETPIIVDQTKTEEAKRMEMFAKRERMVRMRAKQVEDQQKGFQQREEALKARESDLEQYKTLQERLGDPKGLLDIANERGLSIDHLTQAMLDPGRMTDQQLHALRKEVQALKTAQEKQLETAKEAQTASYKQALEIIRSDAKDFIEMEKDNYPTFMEFLTLEGESKPDEFIRDYIEEHHGRHNKVLTVDQAVAQIEKEIIDQGVKYSKFKKVQEIINAKANETLEEKKALVAPKLSPQITTLSHNQISQSNQSRKYTTRERIERAKMIAQGKNPDVA